MWTANDCDASKKRKPFKNCEHGKLEEVGGKRRELGGSGVGVEGPTPTDSLADRFDNVGEPGGRPWATAWTASADRSVSRGRGRARVRAAVRPSNRAMWSRDSHPPAADDCPILYGRTHCNKRGTGRHSPTHLNGRAGCFGIFCLIACAPLSVVVDFRTMYFFFLLLPLHCVLYF